MCSIKKVSAANLINISRTEKFDDNREKVRLVHELVFSKQKNISVKFWLKIPYKFSNGLQTLMNLSDRKVTSLKTFKGEK